MQTSLYLFPYILTVLKLLKVVSGDILKEIMRLLNL